MKLKLPRSSVRPMKEVLKPLAWIIGAFVCIIILAGVGYASYEEAFLSRMVPPPEAPTVISDGTSPAKSIPVPSIAYRIPDPPTQQATGSLPIVGRPPEETLTERICTAGGGSWNACGSACRDASSGADCVEHCVPQCECGGSKDWTCPSQYKCTDWISAKDSSEMEGICRLRNLSIVELDTVKDPKGKTLVVLPRQIAIANPFIIRAPESILEAQTDWALKSGDGTIIAWGNLLQGHPITGPDGKLSIEGYFDQPPTTGNGTFEMFSFSPRLRIVTDAVYASVAFTWERQPVDLYFIDTADNPGMKDCGKVSKVSRVAMGGAEPNRVLMYELLKGPTDEEMEKGFTTAIPTNADVPEIRIVDKKILVDFNGTVQKEVGGSCRVSAIRAQIEKTLQSAHPGAEVVISVNGNVEEALQP